MKLPALKKIRPIARSRIVSLFLVALTVASAQEATNPSDAGADTRRGAPSAFPVTADGSDAPASNKTGSDSKAVTMEQFTVTAGKRTDVVLNVPMAVTAISSEDLTNFGKLRLQDYFATMPGLEFTYGNLGVPFLSIRGLSTGFLSTPTVGIMLDGIPLGSSTALGFGYWAPDIDPSDLSHIELLRGPQGTLYGANSMGGLLNYVTADPSTDNGFGRLQSSIDSVYNGSELGYSVRGTINVPVAKTFAVRLSAFSRHDPGFIDVPAYLYNAQEGRNGINRGNDDGATFAAMWRPWDALSMKLTAVYQDSRSDGGAGINPAVGPLDANPILKDAGWIKNEFAIVAMNADVEVGNLKITSTTGYQMTNIGADPDFTLVFGPYLPIPPMTGVAGPSFSKTNKLTEEVRVALAIGDRLDILAGVYGDDEVNSLPSYLYAINPVTAERLSTLYYQQGGPSSSANYREAAGYANLTGKITKRLEITVGARESLNRQTFQQVDSGPLETAFGNNDPYIVPTVASNDNSFTYLATAKYKLTPEAMTYVRVASGYQPGGPNPGLPVGSNVPAAFGPDKTVDTEFGAKGDFLNHRVSFEVSAYSIDWKSIQTTVYDNTIANTYTLNAGDARSRGLELALSLRPLERLTISAWWAWNRAVLTTGFPQASTTYGAAGDRLPYSQPLSGHFDMNKEFQFAPNWTGFFDYQVSYVGRRVANFRTGPKKSEFYIPAYSASDARFGITHLAWNWSIYITNITDVRGWTNYHPSAPNSNLPPSGSIIRPRTVGASVTYSF